MLFLQEKLAKNTQVNTLLLDCCRKSYIIHYMLMRLMKKICIISAIQFCFIQMHAVRHTIQPIKTAKKKHTVDKIVAQESVELTDNPVEVMLIAESDMIKEAQQSMHIKRYIIAVARACKSLISEEHLYKLWILLIAFLMLLGYAWFSRFIIRFLTIFLDIHEVTFVLAHWTFAYIIIYITAESSGLIASEILNVATCVMLFLGLFELIDVIYDILLDKYKSQQYFLYRIAWLFKSIIFCASIIVLGLLLVSFFQYDTAVSRGASQLLSILVMICFVTFISLIRNRVDKMIVKYIRQKQKQLISFKKTIPEILALNVLNFIMDIWFWLSVGFMCSVSLLWFVSLKLLTLLFKLFITLLIIWAYYISMRLLKGRLLLIIKTYALHQRYIVYRLLKHVLPILKYLIVIMLTGLIFLTWDFSALRMFAKLLSSFSVQSILVVWCLILSWNICVFVAEYYFFIHFYHKGLFTNSPMTRIISSLIKVFAGTGAILVLMKWMGGEPMQLLQSFTVFLASISFVSQTIVRDIAAGFFLSVDHAIEVGDVVEIDGRFGIVEGLTLFAAKIRVENGTLITIQYGELRKIGNKSRSYCFAIINATVAYENNIDHVIKALNDVYLEITNNHQLGKKIISPLEIRGVTKLNGDEMIVQCRFKTKPRFDMPITRLFYIYLKKKFDEYGITIADPRLILGEKLKRKTS